VAGVAETGGVESGPETERRGPKRFAFRNSGKCVSILRHGKR